MTDRATGSPPASTEDGPHEDAAREVEIVRSRDGYRGFFRFEVADLKHRRFDGEMSPVITREILHIPEAAAVLPYDPVTDRIVLIEQFRAGCMRHPTGAWLYEVVAGLVGPGECALETARRELAEEAGLEARRIEQIATYVASPGAVTERSTVFIAEVDASGAGGVHGLEHEAEDIRSFVLPLQTAFDWLESGRILAVNAIVPLRWLQVHHTELRRRWLAETAKTA